MGLFIPLYDDNPLRHLPRPYVNYALIAVTIASFFLDRRPRRICRAERRHQYGFIPSAAGGLEVLGPEYRRIPEKATYLTYAFLHANWAHLLGNMVFLWVFGDNVEDALGHFRYLVFYLALRGRDRLHPRLRGPASPLPLVGASGAVAGVVGAYLMLIRAQSSGSWPSGAFRSGCRRCSCIGAWGLFQVFNLVFSTPGESVAWWAHVGGLVVGALLVIAMRRRGVPLFDRGRRNRASVALQQEPSPCRLIRRAAAFSACRARAETKQHESARAGQAGDRREREAAREAGRLGRRPRQHQDGDEPLRRDRRRGGAPHEGSRQGRGDRARLHRPGAGAGDDPHRPRHGRRPRHPGAGRTASSSRSPSPRS